MGGESSRCGEYRTHLFGGGGWGVTGWYVLFFLYRGFEQGGGLYSFGLESSMVFLLVVYLV